MLSTMSQANDVQPQKTKYTLKNFEPRVYQQTIAAKAISQNTLVVLPTGLGKTGVSLLVALHALNSTNGQVLMVAPTKPLVLQHHKTFLERSTIEESETAAFTGAVKPGEREQDFVTKRIIFSTPQALENDVVSSRISLRNVSVLIVDEAHRATGNYSYVWLVRQLLVHNPRARILSMTASPGSDLETIDEICNNMHVECIEYRTAEDPDVRPYVEETVVKPIYVNLPEAYAEIRDNIKKCLSEIVISLKQKNCLRATNPSAVSKKDLLMLQASLRSEMSQGNFAKEVVEAISLSAMAIKVMHAQELIESQGIEALHSYFADVQTQTEQSQSKAVVQLSQHPLWRLAMIKAKACTTPHPKVDMLKKSLAELFTRNPSAKAIIFSQYRDTLQMLVDSLAAVPSVKTKLFLGQAKKKGTGMSQKQQQEVLAEFSNGAFNVACMSSVGEEGLDIPTVDLVVFYEPIPSAIRTIQRRGRTGRHDTGNVIMLIAKGTRDEAYRWVAQRKEKNMFVILQNYKKTLDKKMKEQSQQAQQSAQQNLASTSVAQRTAAVSSSGKKSDETQAQQLQAQPQNQKYLYVDSRETHNIAIKQLSAQGIAIKFERLDVGDIVVSSRVGIEYKKQEDFVDSILDGRLLDQIKQLKNAFECPLIIVEGENIFGVRNVHPNAILGMLSTIAISYSIPVLQTKNAQQTAMLLNVLVQREQGDASSTFNPHASRKPKTTKELLEYMISSVPGVGLDTGRKLLSHFKTIKQLVDASAEQLEEVEGVGKKTASELYVFFRTVYK